MKVGIIIVNFNGRHLLEKNLLSVVNNGYEDFESVIVDNASIDGSVEYLKKEFPSVKVVESKENLGLEEGII